MTLFLRSARWITLAIWVGAIAFFAFGVAPVAFTALPDTHQAGLIVRASLIALHHMGLIAGTLYAIATLALLGTQRDSHPARAAELILILVMLSLTLFSQYDIIPRMEADRLALGGDVNRAPAEAPARRDFERLHPLSEKLEGCILSLGLINLIIGSLHGRDDFDRFA